MIDSDSSTVITGRRMNGEERPPLFWISLPPGVFSPAVW